MTEFVVDLGEVVERLRAELRAELLEEVRAAAQDGWPEFMAIETAARYLDCPVERLRKLQARNGIPFHQEAIGCRVFFARRDLDGWMAGFRHQRGDA